MDVNEYLNSYKKNRKKELEEKQRMGSLTADEFMELHGIGNQPQKDSTWFSKGAYEDGYQLGDFTKTVLGTVGDVASNVGAGILGMGEKTVDAGAYLLGGIGSVFGADNFRDNMQDFIKKDLYDEEKLSKSILFGLYGDTLDIDKYSVLGEKTDSLAQSGGQLLGTVALQSVGVPWWLTTGVTSFGGEVESAFEQGATYAEAGGSGLITAGLEVALETVSGGISFGGKTLDEGLKHILTSKIGNETAKVLAKLGFDAVGEGAEEVFTEIGSALGRKITYEDETTVKEILTSKEAWDGYLEAFIGGSVLGGSFNINKARNAIKTGIDYDMNLTQNEQSIVDKVAQQQIEHQEKSSGKKLTTKEKRAIKKDVTTMLERGEIDIDTIESIFGGESYKAYDSLIKESDEYKKLADTPLEKLSLNEQKRRDELDAKNMEKSYQDRLLESRQKLTQEVRKTTENDIYLQESYAEQGRKGEVFKLTEEEKKTFTAEEMKIVNKAIESGDINNTRKAHDMVSFVAKLSAQTKTDFDFTNNKKLAEAGYIVEGKTIDGFKEGNKIAVNLQSKKALNTVVGHEITHVLEGTDLYTALQSTLKEYATTKGVYDSLFNKAKENYKNVYKGLTEAEYNKKIEQEVTADLVGDYIFSDMDFVRNLSTKNPNVFQKVFNEIKYMLKVATAGSDAEKQLLKAKKIFEDVYRDTKRNTSEEVQHSLDSSEKAMFWEKVGERKRGYDFPKAQNGDSIFTINNKLVYTWKGYENPKISKVIEIVVEEDSDIENTYTSYMQEDIINDYEASGKYKNTSLEEYTESLSNYYANALGRQVNIKTDNGQDNNSNRSVGKLGSQEKTSRRIEFDVAENQDGTRDTTKSQDNNKQIPIAPTNTSQSGVFFDEKTQMSLSDPSQDIAPMPNGIYGKDVMLDRPIAPEPQGKGMETHEIAPPTNQSVEVNKMIDGTDIPIAPEREVHASIPLPLPNTSEVKGVRMNAEQKTRTPRETAQGKLRSWTETSTESEVVNREILPEDLDQSKIYYEPISNKKTLDTANADLDRMGYDKALEVFNAKLENRTVSLSDIALGERLVQESLKRGDTKTTGELIQNIAILGTELGQKVQALSIIQRMTPEGQLKMLQKVVNRGKAKGDRVFDNVEITQEMIDKILAVYGKDGTYDQNKLNEAVEQVKQDIADQMSVSKMDKVNAWRYLAMLGNPKTHIRNIVSNITMQATTEIKDLVARTTETLAPIKNRTKTFKQATDVVKRFAEQSTAEAKAMLTSENSYSESADIKSKRDVFKTKILQKAYDFNNDLMTKEDWWFKKARYKKSLQEFLTANGIKTQEDINNNPELVEKGKKYATEQAQIATFQQTSWLANKINEIERKNVATQVGVGAILPFKKTPINIAKTGLAYSPLGFAKSLTYDLHQMKKGNIEASQVVDNLAKGVTGSALVYIGYMLAMSGLLNGGGEDDKEGKYDYQLGEQSYSLNFGGSTYSLNWLTPVAMPLFIGANAFEMLEEDKELSFDTTSEALAQTLDPLSEMSFLSSLDSVLTSYESGMGKFAGIGEAMLQNYVTQFAPTLMSQVAQVTDDTKRSTTVAGDSDARMIEQTINKLKYKIPGLRQTLEPTIDIWGNEVKQTENVMARAFETFIAPYSRKDNIANEIDAEIKEVYSQTGDNGVIPTVPNKNVQFKGEKYKMSADEYTDYKKVYGQLANDTLEDLFKTSAYQNSDAEDKAELINRVYKYASDEAKKDYLAKEGVEYTNTTEDNVPVYKTDKIKGAIDNDMTLEEFDLYNRSAGKYYISKVIGGYDTYDAITTSLSELEADKDIYGKQINNSLKYKVVTYLNNLDADYYTKIIMYKAIYTADDRYNVEIINYLNEREDISYQEMADILTELGFKVTADGKIRW